MSLSLVLLLILIYASHHYSVAAEHDNHHQLITIDTLGLDTYDDNLSHAPLDDYYLSIPIEFMDKDGQLRQEKFGYMRSSLTTSHNFYESVVQYCNDNHVVPVDCRLFAKTIRGYIASIESVGYNDLIGDASDFTQLGLKYATDKVTHHGYQRYYPRFIEQYRSLGAENDISGSSVNSHTTVEGNGSGSKSDHVTTYAMLEIGIATGKSLLLWLDYFPHAFIYGIDKDIESAGDRFRIMKADQGEIAEIKSIFEHSDIIQHDHIFLIIDDGSHIPEHQISTFDYLFNHVLAYGGCYIIEDIETSYWTREGIYDHVTRYGYHHTKSIIELFKYLADDINIECLTEANRGLQDDYIDGRVSLLTRQLISSITFGQNCIIITKKTLFEMKYNNRRYRYNHNL